MLLIRAEVDGMTWMNFLVGSFANSLTTDSIMYCNGFSGDFVKGRDNLFHFQFVFPADLYAGSLDIRLSSIIVLVNLRTSYLKRLLTIVNNALF